MHAQKAIPGLATLIALALAVAAVPCAAQPFGDTPPQAPGGQRRVVPAKPVFTPDSARAPQESPESSTAPGAALSPGLAAAISAADKPRSSRWQAEKDRLDTSLRLHLLAPTGAREHWLAAQFDVTDIAARVANLTEARVTTPDNRLYLASLADACMQPTRPQLTECSTVDRLADWATRDPDNGVPAILLGYRALERRDPDIAAADIEQAAAAQRFDDYWSAAEEQWWSYLKDFEPDLDPAARAEAATTWASERVPEWTTALHVLCADQGATTARMRAVCAKVGIAMAERAATFALRRAGARVAAVNADGRESRAVADALQARALEASAQCAAAEPDFASEFESADRAARERAVAAYDRWVAARAKLGEVAACERAVSAAPR